MNFKTKIFYSVLNLLITIFGILNFIFEQKFIKFLVVFIPLLMYVPFFLVQFGHVKYTVDNAFNDNFEGIIPPENTPHHNIQIPDLPAEIVPTLISREPEHNISP